MNNGEKVKTINRVPYDVFLVLMFMLFSVANAMAQQPITGTVTDGDTGETLPGVNISLKGTTTGTSTGSDGHYELNVQSLQDTLLFSFVGYQSQEVPVNGRTELNITLQSQAIAGQEMVVVGYGTQKKNDVATSIASVKIGDKAQTQSINNVGQLLQGSVPGLNAGLATGAKGGTTLEVRGRNSINATNSPLIVLDGARYYGNLSSINPNDIKAINALKGASAAAVYGASAAAGVIEITTKQGNSSVPTINISSSVGFTETSWNQRPWGPEGYLHKLAAGYRRQSPGKPEFYFTDPRNLPDQISVEEWKALDPNVSDNITQTWLKRIGLTSYERENFKNGHIIDWYDQAHQKGLRTNQNVSVSGKNGDLNYYWSLNYNNNKGVVVGDQFRTVRTRLNLETTIADFIKIGINSQYSNQDNGYLPVNTSQVPYQSPYGKKYEDDGSLKWAPNDDQIAASNPFLSTKEAGRKFFNKDNDLVGNFHVELVALPLGLSYKIRWANHFLMNQNYIFNPSTIPAGLPRGNASRNENTSYDWTLDNILTWKRTIAEDHSFDLTLLFEAEGHPIWNSTLSNEQFQPNDNLNFSGINSGSNPVVNDKDGTSTGTGLMGRLNYQFRDRYLLTLSYRRDGYSAFGQNNAYAYFPSIAGGWIISDESFWNVNAINNLKLRVSWGKNGNRSIGVYSALQKFIPDSYIYGTSTAKGLYSSNLPNSNLKWEVTSDTDIGLDFGLFNNRISGSFDFYDMSTKDMLLQRTLPNISGYDNIFTNIGEITNRGLEISLQSQNIQQKNFTWSSSITFSTNHNKVKHLYGDMIDILDKDGNVVGQKEASDRENGWFIDHALDQIYDYKILGVWQTDEADQAAKYDRNPGDFKLQDTNGDGVLSPVGDKIFQGYTKPRYRLSLGNDFSYKNFNLSTMITSYLDYDGAINERQHANYRFSRASGYAVPYWTAQNPTNKYARLNSEVSPPFNVWVNRSFIRLQNVSLAYNISQSFLKKFNIGRLQAYLNVRNAYVVALSGWNFWDPETQDEAPRIYSLGINLSF